jgi:hypothetical protein
MPRILEILDQHIAEAEEKAQKSHDHCKYMMYGYWKAIAVHLRGIRREVKKQFSKNRF